MQTHSTLQLTTSTRGAASPIACRDRRRRRRFATTIIPVAIGLLMSACGSGESTPATSPPPTTGASATTSVPPSTSSTPQTGATTAPTGPTGPGTTAAPTSSPSTSVAPTDDQRTVLAFDDAGKAFQVTAGDAEATTLFDVGPLNGSWEMLDVSFANGVAFVGTCCEPATGAVFEVPLADQKPADNPAPGYGLSISPDDRFLAVGSFVDNPVTIKDLTTGEWVDSDPAPGWADLAIGENQPVDVMWLDDQRLLFLQVRSSGEYADNPDYVLYDTTIDDSGHITSVSDAIPTGLSPGGANYMVYFAGRPDAGSTIALHGVGDSDVVLFDLESQQSTRQSVGDASYTTVWYDQGGHLTTVDADGALTVDGTLIPGTYTWARTT